MALRIRKDGRVLCAAMHKEELGDTYIDDGIHYFLSIENKIKLIRIPYSEKQNINKILMEEFKICLKDV